MNKFNLKTILLLISLVFTSSQFVTLIGLQSTYGNNKNLNPITINNVDALSSSLSSEMQSENLNSNKFNNENIQIFDDSLNEYIINLTSIKEKIYQKVNVIIQFEASVNKKDRIDIIDSLFEDYEIIANYDIISGVYLRINPQELISKEMELNNAKIIEKIYKSKVFDSPYMVKNLPEINALSAKNYPNWWVPAVGADNLIYDGSGVRVAVVDTGIYPHPDLDIVENKNFVSDESSSNYNDDVGHGTHVGGIIAGSGSSSGGVYRGIAPGALLINARAGNATGLEEGAIISAIEWASEPIGIGGAGADIISMSFGGGYPDINDPITEAISNAIETYGVIFVASAGNSGPAFFTGSTPASGIDVISVGAIDENGNLASFSSWGPTFGYLNYPDVVAPGVNIISTEAKDSVISEEMRYIGDFFDYSGDGDYIPLSGTSMSCPMVSGALAILKEAYPSITPETARIALLEGAKKLTYENESYYLKSGAGLINVSASLDYLSTLTSNYNDTAKVYPDNLPIKPYDLLNFPGDHQEFNLTVISGKSNVYNFEIPSIDGLSISISQPTLSFTNAGINFTSLDIIIEQGAIPGIRTFQINLTDGIQIYDILPISLDIRLPEHRILMESYHGLNDWFPEYSFYQMGFYEAMRDLYDMNISIDYNMEYWTPNYNERVNNSLLTEERLAQYELIIIQNPILPYNYLEVENLKDYFNNGGDILFLGTRYQDLAVTNINDLFEALEINIEINQDNIMNDKWLGIGTAISSQSVTQFNNAFIFSNVNKFIWEYGNSFNVLGSAKSIATIDGSSVAAMYNGTALGKGRFLAFGDLHWLYSDYKANSYYTDHKALLSNIIAYFLPEDNVSIEARLNDERISTSQIGLTIYMKNQLSEMPITSYDSLAVTIKNDSFSESIGLNETNSIHGIYFNNTFNLPYPSYNPYQIEINLTISGVEYFKYSKILYYDLSKVPQIIDLSTDKQEITRATSQSIDLTAQLDSSGYGNIDGFLSLYSYSFYNSKQTINKSIIFNNIGGSNYEYTFDPSSSDPSGYGIFYVLPFNDNYTNPNSPRQLFQIINNPPMFIESNSFFNYGSGDIAFDDTYTSAGSYAYQVSQGTSIDFQIDVVDSVYYEDTSAEMRVFVNLFVCSVSTEGYVMIIFPSEIVVDELSYQVTSNNFEGSFTIPNSMSYSSITGTKSRSTVSNFDSSTNLGYLSILYIRVYDSEGGYDDFIIILSISKAPMDLTLILLIVIPIIAIVVILSLSIYLVRKRKRKRVERPYYPEYYYQAPPTSETEAFKESHETSSIVSAIPEGREIYCPFCGYYIKIPKKFCPSCGRSLEFK